MAADDYPMGALADESSYDPFAAEKFVPPAVADQTRLMAGKDVDTIKHVMGGLADMTTLPKRAIENSQFATTTGVYDPRVPVEAALMTMGGGVAGTGEKAGVDLAAGYDPKLWHGVSQIKLPKPVTEMSSVLRPVNPAPETVISPARLQNSMLMPLLGDRTAAAAELARVNGFPFENTVPLQGGHGYMANTPDMAWAAGKSIAPGIAKVARESAESGLPVHGVYTAMGERSADFSHMMSDTLAEMAKHTKITPEGEQIFNATMRKIAPDFPGVLDPNVAQYLRAAPGELRNNFAKSMDTAPMQKYGFPSVAEARVAVTDPRLLNEPTGASGLSIARMDPKGTLGPSGHLTYDTGVGGKYIGGLPASIPKEIMYPDIVGPLSQHADAVAAKRAEAGLKPFRPTEDYLMGRTPKGLPKVQEANQQWVDAVSKHLEDRGFTLGSGATEKPGAAAIQGIRAYHSSPHDFDRFDLSKIGTGEGAQVYGHGLYFAENPAVSGQGGQYWQQFKSRFGDTPEAYAANVLESAKFDRGRATADLDRLLKTYGDNAPVTAREARALLASDKPVGPRTYEVNINADPAHFLDWDKPLSGQSEAVREALSPQRLGLKAAGPLGEKGYYGWTDAQNRLIGRAQTKDLPAEIFDPREMAPSVYRGGGTWKPPEASERLREAGIPGIKYLDEGSRGVWDVRENSKGFRGQQSISPGYGGAMSEYFPTRNAAQDWINKTRTSNYVVFDPNRVDIMKKYAVPGAIGAGGMGALTAQDQYQPGGM